MRVCVGLLHIWLILKCVLNNFWTTFLNSLSTSTTKLCARAKSNFDFISCVAPDGILFFLHLPCPCPSHHILVFLLGFQFNFSRLRVWRKVLPTDTHTHIPTHSHWPRNGKPEKHPKPRKFWRQLDKVNSLMGQERQRKKEEKPGKNKEKHDKQFVVIDICCCRYFPVKAKKKT